MKVSTTENDSQNGNEYLALLKEAIARRATDLHIDPLIDGYQLRLRIDGVLVLLRAETRKAGEKLINQFKASAGLEPGAVFTPRGVRQKFEIEGYLVDCRITLAPCLSGPKMAIRLQDPRMIFQSVAELGIDETGLSNIHGWMTGMNGMFLVTGPTASGKTTTLYALLHEVAEASQHVVTIEDPVEYEVNGINQIQVDLRHGLNFANGVRTTLRLDPDLIMIGELREPEAAAASTSSAVAGHVVMASLHARDAVSAITALRNFGVLDHQTAAALGLVVNQRLIRKLCKKCRKQSVLSEAQTEWFQTHNIDPPEQAWTSKGCAECDGTGFFGRSGLFEVWNLDEGDYEMILAGADELTLRERLARRHHHTLWHAAVAKIDTGITTFEEVQRLGLALPWE